MRSILYVAAAITAAIVTIAGSGVPAAAREPDPTQDRIDQVLAEFPGGVQTGPATVAWEGGAVVLTVVVPGSEAARSVGDCATGAYCAYAATNLGGSKLAFTTCDTTVSTAPLGSAVRSVANARGTGYVQAKNAGGTTLATISAGGQLNSAPAGISQLRCVS